MHCFEMCANFQIKWLGYSFCLFFRTFVNLTSKIKAKIKLKLGNNIQLKVCLRLIEYLVTNKSWNVTQFDWSWGLITTLFSTYSWIREVVVTMSTGHCSYCLFISVFCEKSSLFFTNGQHQITFYQLMIQVGSE